MSRLFGDHTLFSAVKRFAYLVRQTGLTGTSAIIVSGLAVSKPRSCLTDKRIQDLAPTGTSTA
jgi:hypothetical protein